jgi:hypothetical protein
VRNHGRNSFAIKASIELQSVVLDAFEKAIEAREAQTAQAERIRALETEVADLKAWGSEKEQYELKPNWTGAVAYMLKPEARDSETPHWLCPNCYTNGKKSFLIPSEAVNPTKSLYKCATCPTEAVMSGKPKWDDPTQNSA